MQKMFNGTDSERDRLLENRKEYAFELAPGSESILFKSAGTGVMDYFSARIHAGNVESALRNCIVKIYFDASAVPQVEAPLGDFFGAGPGLNPYRSLPFSVRMDSLMECRFPMPFRDSLRIMVTNLSDNPVQIKGQLRIGGYEWQEGTSMYFKAGWAMDRGLKASNKTVRDIPYQLMQGSGRIVGISACLYNPSGAVTSWGNWWGEGDEKIFFDGEKFPSFFGTGSEDYFNYSWSAENIFFFPYCGQPRNDGPGNRGHVSNFRWHIFDDLIFTESIAFYMELFHHGEVPGFSYGRMVYAYALPGSIDDRIPVTGDETGNIPYDYWEPEAYLGSAGFSFFQAEDILFDDPSVNMEEGNRWSAGKILIWKPGSYDEQLDFILNIPENGEYILGMTLAHLPEGGEVWIRVNDKPVKFGDSDTIGLAETGHIQLRNHFSKPVYLTKGDNQLSIGTTERGTGKKVSIDFFWLKEK